MATCPYGWHTKIGCMKIYKCIIVSLCCALAMCLVMWPGHVISQLMRSWRQALPPTLAVSHPLTRMGHLHLRWWAKKACETLHIHASLVQAHNYVGICEFNSLRIFCHHTILCSNGHNCIFITRKHRCMHIMYCSKYVSLVYYKL